MASTLDVKDFSQVTSLQNDDRLLITVAANNHYAGSMTAALFKSAFLQPLIDASTPTGVLKCLYMTQAEYDALLQTDTNTLYVVVEEGAITAAYLGDYPFSTGGGAGTIPVTDVNLNVNQLTLELGATNQLTATWQPDDATSTSMSWLTTNLAIATVSAGLVTAVGKGQCTITVRARSGVTDTCIVDVIVTLTNIELSSEYSSLVPGYTATVTAIPTPTNADIDLTWASSNPSAISVTESPTNTKIATASSDIIGSGTLTVTGAATADGYIFVKPNEVYEIVVESGDTAIQVADKIRAASYTNWTTGGSTGTNIVSFTKTSAGLCYSPSILDAVTAYEIDTLTVNTIPSTSGNVTVTLDGTATVIALSTTTHTTRQLVATAIAAGTYTGFTASASDRVVTFTATATGRKVFPVFTDTGTTSCTATFKRTTRGDTATGVTGTFVTNDPSSVTITATDVKGVNKSLGFTIEPYTISVDSSTLDDTDNSTTSIFTDWQIARTGTVSLYKFKETYIKDGLPYTLQEIDYTAIPENNIVQIELYAEFGNKIITWTFEDAGGKETTVIWNILYKEPELVHHSFNVDVVCTSEEAAALTMSVPYFKYNKRFASCQRNDDGRPTTWRTLFRYTNREWDDRIPLATPHRQSYIDALTSTDRQKAPRRLGYSDGCGILKTFVYDTAGTVRSIDSATQAKIYAWENGDNNQDQIDSFDMQKMKDYGAHFLMHNLLMFDDDPVQPAFANDYSYPLQRDRQSIFDIWGYTSITYANPDGDWWYTRPCIKDPKTLVLSGGGKAFLIDPNDIYGRPSNRVKYGAYDSLANVTLAEIRNTLLTDYVVLEDATVFSWIDQYSKALQGIPTLITELKHSIGYGSSPTALNLNKQRFSNLYDTCGAAGNDYVWVCSADEAIEYMYYQRVANITKTITGTGCRFNIEFDIPDYLSYKTYSVIINNLPSTATVSMSTSETLTYYSKNISTGLINWGISTDISERANRYVASYLAAPTNDKLDMAWYFVRQMGELGSTLSAQLPAFNELPVISNISYDSTPTDITVSITTTNSNKEFGEADALEVSTDSGFATYSTYPLVFADHKYYDELDSSCNTNVIDIGINSNFGVATTYYTRFKNFRGYSNIYNMSITLTRVSGVNDPAMVWALPDKFTSDTEVTFTITHSYISSMRYKITDTYSNWIDPVESITLTLTKDTVYSIVVQGKNNLDEIVEQTLNFTFTGKQRVVLFANVASGTITDIGYVNTRERAYTSSPVIRDLENNAFCTEQGQYYTYFPTQLDALRAKWGITEISSISQAYWSKPSLLTEGGSYPNSIISNGTNTKVELYGGIRTDSTYQVAKYFTGVPTGTYNVRLLVTENANGSTSATNPNVLRVNDTIQTITDTTVFKNNNSVWHTFNGVTVGADGYMLISQYTTTMFTAAQFHVAPIVLIEITKVS